jgi:hypothetical protein
MSSPLSFTDEETALLSDPQFFHKKAKITEKIRGQLEAVRDALKIEISECTLLTPTEFEAGNFQFVKGEHLEDFPYQYLDYPKHFHGIEKCTFRTLFWWGHHVACAWILEGSVVKRYKKHLVDRFHSIAGQELELSIAPTLWEWKRGEGYTLPITHDRRAQIAAVVAERSYLKIIRFMTVDDARVKGGELDAVSRQAFRAMRPIVTA